MPARRTGFYCSDHLVMRVILRSASPRQLALFSLAWARLTDTPMPPSVVLCVLLRSGGKIPES